MKIDRPREALVPLLGVGCGIFALLILTVIGDEHQLAAAPASLFLATALALIGARSGQPSSLRFDWFHPSVLVAIFFLVYLVLPGVWLFFAHNYEPLWIPSPIEYAFAANATVVIGAVSVVAFSIASSSGISVGRHAQSTWRYGELKWTVMALLLVGGVAKAYHVAIIGGPAGLMSDEILRQLSPAYRRENSTEISFLVLILESCLDWAFLLMAFLYIAAKRRVGRRKQLFLLIAFAAVVVTLNYLLAPKRTAVIPLFLLPAIWFHYTVRRIRTAEIFIYGSISLTLVGLLLLLRIAMPLLAQGLQPGDYLGETVLDVFSFYLDSPEWATFEMAVASFLHRDELLRAADGSLFGFLKYSFSTLIVLIPRAVWPTKPSYEDLSHIYFQVLWGSSDAVGMAPTIWGASILLFNFSGLIVTMLILGWLSGVAYRSLSPSSQNPRGALLYGVLFWMLFQVLRFGTLGFVFLYFIQSMLIGFLCILILFKRRRADTHGWSAGGGAIT